MEALRFVLGGNAHDVRHRKTEHFLTIPSKHEIAFLLSVVIREDLIGQALTVPDHVVSHHCVECVPAEPAVGPVTNMLCQLRRYPTAFAEQLARTTATA